MFRSLIVIINLFQREILSSPPLLKAHFLSVIAKSKISRKALTQKSIQADSIMARINM